MQAYSNPKRENDPYELPDVEVFFAHPGEYETEHDYDDDENVYNGTLPSGWYWWTCLPGCLPDSEPSGPFATKEEALADAQSDADECSDEDEQDIEPTRLLEEESAMERDRS